jgi:hypothetical protein
VAAPGKTRNPEVLSSLQRILTSPSFIQSPRICRFLRFIVETRLAGDLDQLKESIIGIAVFDRPAGYDPKLDAIVRVEARRLRGKLLEYYSADGAADTCASSCRRARMSPSSNPTSR